MASLLSILKSVLNLNHKNIHICGFEEKIVSVHHFCETFEQRQIHIHATPYKRAQGRCPVCGRKCPGYDHKRDVPSAWRASNLNGIPVYIFYQPQRVECPEHGILTENIPWADGDSRFTPEFNNEIAWLACRMSRYDISLYEGINWRTVGNCIKASHSRLEPDVSERMHDLKRICVDETSYRKGHKYITVVYDMDRNRTVWVHDGNGLEIFRLFCEALPPEERAKIEIVAGDGAQWIDQCTDQYFPNATRCIDFFHVAEWANETLDDVRTNTANKAKREYEHRAKEIKQAETQERSGIEARNREIKENIEAIRKELTVFPRKRGRPTRREHDLHVQLKELKDMLPKGTNTQRKVGRPKKGNYSPEHQEELDRLSSNVKKIKSSRYALGRNPEHCTERQREKIQLIENSYPDLYRAYQLKESLRLILHMNDYESAKEYLDQWIVDAAVSELEPMEELSEKISRHRTNILNSIRLQANSAKSEAVNTTIKVLIKMARGFRNIDNMIALIYLKCSDIVIPLNNRLQMTAEKAAAARKAANERRKKRLSQPFPA